MIETERLELLPLTARQLELWVFDLPALERELHCRYLAEPMEGSFAEIVKGQMEPTAKDPEHCYWHSFWFLIRKSDRTVVGSADFKSPPDENGETEIGYGLGKDFEHNGYMTETVQAMCEWAMRQNGVSHVIAETETDNYPSQRVLQRCGFTEYARAETIWWRR